jgi:hypothetical protein
MLMRKIIDINHYLIDLLGYSKEYFLNSKFGIWNFLAIVPNKINF